MAAGKLSLQACPLQEKWKHMFSEKSLKIKAIQQSVFSFSFPDSFQFECCGFMSIKDRGYPFPDAQHTSNACVEKYGFLQPCLPALEKATHKAALIFFLTLIVAIVTIVSPFDTRLTLGWIRIRSYLV